MPNSYDVDDILEEIKRKRMRESNAGTEYTAPQADSLGPC